MVNDKNDGYRMLKKSLKIPKGGNQNPYIQERTTQWPNEKVQKDKQRSTKHTHKTNDWVTRTPLKQGWTQVLRKGSSSCSTSGTRRFDNGCKPGGKSWMRKGSGTDFVILIFAVVCNIKKSRV
jgi:hypothetical protein